MIPWGEVGNLTSETFFFSQLEERLFWLTDEGTKEAADVDGIRGLTTGVGVL